MGSTYHFSLHLFHFIRFLVFLRLTFHLIVIVGAFSIVDALILVIDNEAVLLRQFNSLSVSAWLCAQRDR